MPRGRQAIPALPRPDPALVKRLAEIGRRYIGEHKPTIRALLGDERP
jgi:hypothetical protein